MDQRQTFANSAELLQFLNGLHKEGKQAALLVDNGGLERMHGMITEVREEGQCIVLDSRPEDTVQVHEIVAVNGIFRGDYSEC